MNSNKWYASLQQLMCLLSFCRSLLKHLSIRCHQIFTVPEASDSICGSQRNKAWGPGQRSRFTAAPGAALSLLPSHHCLHCCLNSCTQTFAASTPPSCPCGPRSQPAQRFLTLHCLEMDMNQSPGLHSVAPITLLRHLLHYQTFLSKPKWEDEMECQDRERTWSLQGEEGKRGKGERSSSENSNCSTAQATHLQSCPWKIDREGEGEPGTIYSCNSEFSEHSNQCFYLSVPSKALHIYASEVTMAQNALQSSLKNIWNPFNMVLLSWNQSTLHKYTFSYLEIQCYNCVFTRVCITQYLPLHQWLLQGF